MEDFVKLIGTAAAHADGTTMTITIPTDGVPAGDFILVAVASDYTTGVPTVTDDGPGSSANRYVLDKSASEGTDLRVSWLRCVVSTELSAGRSLIITTSSGVVARAAIAIQFTGVSGTLDGSGSSSSEHSNNPHASWVPDHNFDLHIASVAARQAQSGGMTMDWLKACNPVGTSAGSGDITLGVAYRFAYKGGSAVSYSGKLGAPTGCVTIIGGYRLAAVPAETLSLEDKIMSLEPIAYLRLDDPDKSEGARARNSSGNGHRDGVYHGGCSVTDGPIEGSTATRFDGIGGYVEIIPDDDAFSISTSGYGLTVMRFVRPDVVRFPPNSDSSGVAGTVVDGPYKLPASTILVSDVTYLSDSGYITAVTDKGSVVTINYTGKSGGVNGTLTDCSTPNGTGKTISTGAATLQNDAFVYIDGKGADHQHEWGCRFYSDTDANPARPRPNEISFYTWNLDGGEGSGAHDLGPFVNGAYRMLVGAADGGDRDVPDAGNRLWTDGILQQAPLALGTLYSNPEFHIIPQKGKKPVRIGTRTKAAYFGGAVSQWAVFGRVLKDQEVYRLFLAWTNMSKTQHNSRWAAT
jgi:hypothetical protein